jgi:hypothetical protein
MIANLEQDNWPVDLLLKQDSLMTTVLGESLPSIAFPSKRYAGGLRIIVPAVRTSLGEDEDLSLKVIVLGEHDPEKTILRWKPLGTEQAYEEILGHAARACTG